MMPGAGLVTPWMTRRAAHDGVVDLHLDVREHRFLRDHLVDGRPLLPTVLSLESMVCAAQLVRPDAPIAAVLNLQVGPPFLLPATGKGSVSVSVTATGASTLRCALRSPGSSEHVTADVVLGSTPPQPSAATAVDDGLPWVAAEVIYGLYFHGPSFRVIGSAQAGRQVARARLAAELPSTVDPPRRSAAAPLLVELCLQAAGLWDLADSARMTIPLGIDRVRRFTDIDTDNVGPLTAIVTPRNNRSVFDAVVVDAAGFVHLAVDGYRTTPFPHAFDAAAAERVRTALAAL